MSIAAGDCLHNVHTKPFLTHWRQNKSAARDKTLRTAQDGQNFFMTVISTLPLFTPTVTSSARLVMSDFSSSSHC